MPTVHVLLLLLYNHKGTLWCSDSGLWPLACATMWMTSEGMKKAEYEQKFRQVYINFSQCVKARIWHSFFIHGEQTWRPNTQEPPLAGSVTPIHTHIHPYTHRHAHTYTQRHTHMSVLIQCLSSVLNGLLIHFRPASVCKNASFPLSTQGACLEGNYVEWIHCEWLLHCI